jgi:thiol-disulfide isomerase/thioredoxin
MKALKIISLAAALALAAGAAQAGDVGKPARDFKITTLSGETVRLADLKGKVVVVNRWATWCTPCKAEMVVFENYLRTHRNSDLKIYAVMTESEVPFSKLKPLQAALSFPIAKRLSGRGYGVKDGVPTSYVIDREGVLRFAAAGAFDKQSFEELVGPLLAEAAPSAPPAQSVAAR